MKQDILIIGDGIAGLMSAYFLHKQNRNITVVNKSSNIKDKTSFGNAGLLSAFGKEPLSHPGILLDTLRLFLSNNSALSFKPSFSHLFNLSMLRWAYRFFLLPTKENTLSRMALFEKYGEISANFYNEFQNDLGYDIDFHRLGFLMYFKDRKNYLKKKEYFKHFSNLGEIINKEKQKELAPLLKIKKEQSILMHKNSWIDPQKTIISLKNYLIKQGVQFIDNDEIIDLEFSNQKISNAISINGNSYKANEYIMATGYNVSLAKKLNKNLLLLPTKGYSATFTMDENIKPKIPILIADKFAIITPRKNDVRITSKLEIGSYDTKIDNKQITNIINIFQEESHEMSIKDIKPWSGIRALTTNDKPLIGKDKNYNNMTYAMGLGWLGMTFAPAIGEMIASLIVNGKANDDIVAFSGL